MTEPRRQVPGRRLTATERRLHLLDVGKQIFSARPFDEVSTDELAQAAGISKGLLYHYFSNKRGYYVAVVECLATELIAATQIDATLSPEDAWQDAIAGFYGFLADNGYMYRALIRGGIGSDAETATEIERVREALVARLTQTLNLPSDLPEQRARLNGWVGYAEAVGLHQVERKDLSLEQFTAILVSALAHVAL